MARRRRIALGAVALLAAAVGVAVGAGDDGGGPTSPGTSQAPAAECPPEVAADDRRLAGQALIVTMQDTATPELRRAVRRGEVGGVILFPTSGADPTAVAQEVEALRRAAAGSGAPAPIVTIDQEGGSVKRFPGLPPRQSPPEIQQAEVAATEGARTGEALAEIGVTVDLAPVVDVPSVSGSIVEGRAFGGGTPASTDSAVAFGRSLQQAGVAATAKHFPGLGLATTNTDDAPTTISASRKELDPEIAAFASAVEAGFRLVMVSNAAYAAVDAKRPASQSPKVVDGLLRDELGFDGVVITDDLGAGALTGSGTGEGEAAVAAADAGADLLLFAHSDGSEAHAALVRALRTGELARESMLASCARVIALREDFG